MTKKSNKKDIAVGSGKTLDCVMKAQSYEIVRKHYCISTDNCVSLIGKKKIAVAKEKFMSRKQTAFGTDNFHLGQKAVNICEKHFLLIFSWSYLAWP